MSGYLITTLLIGEREKTGRISLPLFYARRALRIFPPMYAIFATTLLYHLATHQMAGITIAGVCSQLFYYQNYWSHGGVVPGLGLLWSLAIEEHFYLVFPLLVSVLTSNFKMGYGRIAVTLLSVCAVILAWRCCVVAFMPDGVRWARDATDTRADSILFGCALASFERTGLYRRLPNSGRYYRFLLPACTAILLCTFLVRNAYFRETLRYTLQGIAIAPLLFYVVSYPTSFLGKLLNSRALSQVGVFSYSLYLIHLSVILQVNKAIHSGVLAAFVSFAISITAAFFVHLVIEIPSDRVRKRLRPHPPLAQFDPVLTKPSLLSASF